MPLKDPIEQDAAGVMKPVLGGTIEPERTLATAVRLLIQMLDDGIKHRCLLHGACTIHSGPEFRPRGEVLWHIAKLVDADGVETSRHNEARRCVVRAEAVELVQCALWEAGLGECVVSRRAALQM